MCIYVKCGIGFVAQNERHKIKKRLTNHCLPLEFYIVGMTGFEPATPGPPDQCANRAAPHPELFQLSSKPSKYSQFAILIHVYKSLFLPLRKPLVKAFRQVINTWRNYLVINFNTSVSFCNYLNINTK